MVVVSAAGAAGRAFGVGADGSLSTSWLVGVSCSPS